MENYSFNLHKHNYSIWTAARAVQRGFTTTANIKIAIEKSGLQNFAEDDLYYTEDEFEFFHKKCSAELTDAFKEMNISVSYGRTAKIISIYLKTSVILCNKGQCDKSKIIHPPIDSILLIRIGTEFKELKYLKKKRWTNLDSTAYWELVTVLKLHLKKLDWTLEKYWNPTLAL
jgi:hypothetical protein